MEHEMAVEHHHSHTQTGDDGAHCLQPGDTLRMAIDNGKEQHGKQRTRTDNQRGVRGCGIKHGRILCQEIHGAARNAQHHHQQLVLQGFAEQTEAMSGEGKSQQQDVGDDKAQGKDLRRR